LVLNIFIVIQTFSLLDGYATVEEYAARSKLIGQHFLCITDHGMMGAIPRQIRACEEITSEGHKLKPIFGIELYLQNKHVPKEIMDEMSPEDKKEVRKSYHLLAIAFNNNGYKNLVQLSSWAWINGFYYKPRVTHEQLLKHKEGIIFTSCCYNGEIGQAFDRGLPDYGRASELAEEKLRLYMEMFGENFYLELMLLDFKKQKPFDKWLIWAHDKYHIPLILSQDAHYSNKEDSYFQRLMLMVQNNKTIADIEKAMQAEDSMDIFELQDKNLWMKSESELDEKYLEVDPTGFCYRDIIPEALYEQAKSNTVKICEKACGVELDRSIKLPKIEDAEIKFLDAIAEGFKWRGLKGNTKYEKRIREEYELICRKEYPSYFLIQKMFTDRARKVSPEILGWGTGDEALGPG
jgi:DNA polymerase III subunit alpha